MTAAPSVEERSSNVAGKILVGLVSLQYSSAPRRTRENTHPSDEHVRFCPTGTSLTRCTPRSARARKSQFPTAEDSTPATAAHETFARDSSHVLRSALPVSWMFSRRSHPAAARAYTPPSILTDFHAHTSAEGMRLSVPWKLGNAPKGTKRRRVSLSDRRSTNESVPSSALSSTVTESVSNSATYTRLPAPCAASSTSTNADA
mmetsp:Transcript_5888/g.14328  ORF Transcript_5888/g.14328 Transcript_5888/m.14328 type:complete len:203 (+) Transcript_5888:187-795(+)